MESAQIFLLGCVDVYECVERHRDASGVLSSAVLQVCERIVPPAIGALKEGRIPGEIARYGIGAEDIVIRRRVGLEGLDLDDRLLSTVPHDQVITEINVGSRPQRARAIDESVVVD